MIIGDGREGYVNDAIRNKLKSESGDTGKHFLVERKAGVDGGNALLAAANSQSVTKLAGLFDHVYHTADDSDYSPENPTLAESTIAALTVLNKNPDGFILIVEGGAIDWAGHANNMDQMIGEMIDFNEAVQAVIDWVNDSNNGSGWNNTLVIVTGDHETGYLTGGWGVFPDWPLGDVNNSTLTLEKIVSNSGGQRASWEDDGDSIIESGETVYWVWNSSGHTNSLIPLYARGVGEELFENYATNYDSVRGAYLDNTHVFFVMDSVIGNSNTPPTYTITATAGSGGNISPSGVVTVKYGNGQSFAVTPNTGYHVVSVTGCEGTWTGTNPYITGLITADCTVTATFAAIKGNVNGDSKVDIVDALLVARYAAELSVNNFIFEAADVNCDASIDVVDALLIAGKAAGLPISNWCSD
ncbi:MAG: alkaline phosphatase [Nitrospirota bacterium]